LHRFFFKKSFLQGMHLLAFRQALDGRYVLFSYRTNRQYTRTPCDSIDPHGTRPALTFAATILAPGQVQFIPQNAKKGNGLMGINGADTSIHTQSGNFAHRIAPPCLARMARSFRPRKVKV
jgi:hypothetical protein